MNKYRRHLTTFLVISVISLFLVLGLFSLPQEAPESKVLGLKDSITTESEYKEFTYDGETVKYDPMTFEIKENNGAMLILPTSAALFQYAELGEFETQETLFDELKSLPLYSNLTKHFSEMKDSYAISLFSFEQPSLLVEGNPRELYLTVYETTNNYYIAVRNFNYTESDALNNSFINLLSQLQGEDYEVLGLTNSQTDLARVLGQASTVQLFARNCYDVTFSTALTGATFAGKTYEICGAGMGTGFMINGSGNILTNAHVAKPNSFDSIADGISTDGSYEQDMGNDLIDILYTYLGNYIYLLTDDEIQTFYIYILDELNQEGYIDITSTTDDIYVQFGSKFEIDYDTLDITNKSEHQSATLIDANEIASEYQVIMASIEAEELVNSDLEELVDSSVEEGFTGVSDIALVKLDTDRNIPSLAISQVPPMQSESIYVIGYPGINEDSMLTDSRAPLNSTITSGTITGIQANTTGTYNLLQIDASVESGNSGGPIIGSEGDVLGMTTYASYSGSGNYNWGISSEELNKFITQAGTVSEINDEGDLLVDAMNDISRDYYSNAQEKLEELIAGESTLSSVLSPIVTVCTTQIEAGNDKSPWFDISFLTLPNWGVLVIGGILLTIIVITVIIVLVKKADKKNLGVPSYNYTDAVPNNTAPVTPTPAPTQQQAQTQQPAAPVQQNTQPVQQQTPVQNSNGQQPPAQNSNL